MNSPTHLKLLLVGDVTVTNSRRAMAKCGEPRKQRVPSVIPLSETPGSGASKTCDSEEEAFLRFARAIRDNVVLLIDTYDTEAAAMRVVRLAPKLKTEGIQVNAVRLDSGDLVEHARRVAESNRPRHWPGLVAQRLVA